MGRLETVVTGAHGFRSDINALRALSVAAVVGYHLQLPAFSGGFVGVDVFFVITGYLMTRKILDELALDRFSIINFVAMRARRIYPALVATVISSVIAGWFLTMPDQYFRQLRQAFYALLFLSNFAFDNDNGYFSLAAQTKPLLHTWSLAVEWQFYIWLPLVASAVWRACGPRSRIAAFTRALQIVTALSLAWCLWKSQSDVLGSAFFSLRSRAWEPLAGGLIALYEFRRSIEASGSNIKRASVAGWALIAACVVYPMPEHAWPAALTLLPVLGSVTVIATGQQINLFAAHPIQRLGDWSYSIYLWHWPVWVFAVGWLTLRGYDVTPWVKTCVVLASLALGYASYRFIEQPVRTRRNAWTLHRMATASSVTIACLAGFAALAYVNGGFPDRMPAYLQQAFLARQTDTPHDECFRNSNSIKKSSGTYCVFGADRLEKPIAILWGDSFANQYLDPISSAASSNGVSGLIATQSACRAFIDDDSDKSGREKRPCRDFNRDTLEFVLREAEPSIVVLASNWSDATEVSALVDRLLTSDKIVILVMPLLHVGFDVPQRWIETQLRAGRSIDEWKVAAEPGVTMNALRTEIAARLAKHDGDPRLITVDPSSVICDTGFCYLVRNGQSNFRDTAHISNVTAMQYKAMFHAAFRSATLTRVEAAASSN